mmetsp:Transcript_172403/g.547411  ORF Transcript_172403/g.547411 Transcript_172403/m.547411 type:complete len:131 (+) Transcript_172403:490-882(+)
MSLEEAPTCTLKAPSMRRQPSDSVAGAGVGLAVGVGVTGPPPSPILPPLLRDGLLDEAPLQRLGRTRRRAAHRPLRGEGCRTGGDQGEAGGALSAEAGVAAPRRNGRGAWSQEGVLVLLAAIDMLILHEG